MRRAAKGKKKTRAAKGKKKTKTRRRLLSQLLKNARPKLRPRLRQRSQRRSPRATKRLRGISSLAASHTTSTKNGSPASSRALGSCLAFESLLIVTPAVPKGNSRFAIMV